MPGVSSCSLLFLKPMFVAEPVKKQRKDDDKVTELERASDGLRAERGKNDAG